MGVADDSGSFTSDCDGGCGGIGCQRYINFALIIANAFDLKH